MTGGRTSFLDIDPASGLARFIGNAPLYREFLTQFLYDGSFEEFCEAAALGKMVMADEALHTLMGTSANLSLERLHHTAGEAAVRLRRESGPEAVREAVDDVTAAYQAACEAVRAYLREA